MINLLMLGCALAAEPDPDRSRPPTVAALPVPPLPVPQVLALSDGTPVWLVERHDVPLVRVELSLQHGWLGAPDPLATRLLGALVDEGTAAMDPVEWADAVADLGAEVSVGVGVMRAWADVEAVSGTEAEALALARDALLSPALTRKELRRVRRAWVRSRQNAWRSGATVHDAALTRAVYPADHLLGFLARPADYRRLTRRRVLAAWRWLVEHARPVVLVVGDTTADEILPILERTWAGLSGLQRWPEVPAPPRSGPKVVLVDHPGVSQAAITLSLPAPGAGSPELPAAELVDEVLGGSFTSRLNANLREDKGYTYGIGSTIRTWPGHGRLAVETTVDGGVAGLTLGEIHDEIWRITAVPVTAEELAAARNTLLVQAAVRLGTLESLAFDLGLLLAYDQPPEAGLQRLERLDGLTLEEVRAEAEALFDDDDVVWVITGDRAALLPVLEAAEWVPTEVWTGRSLILEGGVLEGGPPAPGARR